MPSILRRKRTIRQTDHRHRAVAAGDRLIARI
jgi:hypothetical protein